MKRKDVVTFAQELSLGPQAREYRANWVNFQCPWARTRHTGGTDKSKGFGISCDSGMSSYFCLACKVKGQFVSLPSALGTLRKQDYSNIQREIQRTEIIGPRLVPKTWGDKYKAEFTEHETDAVYTLPPRHAEFAYPSAIGHPYLRERGISATTTLKLGLRFDPAQQRILFPVHDPRGRFAGFSGRSVIGPHSYDDKGRGLDARGKKFLKVRDYFGLRKSNFLLGEHRVYASDDASTVGRAFRSRKVGGTIVCEGLFDYAWLYEMGYRNTVSVMGSWFAETRLRRLIKYGRGLVLFLDNDFAGHEAKDIIVAQTWGALPVFEVTYPDDMVDADPSVVPVTVANKMLRNTKLITRVPTAELLTKYGRSYSL